MINDGNGCEIESIGGGYGIRYAPSKCQYFVCGDCLKFINPSTGDFYSCNPNLCKGGMYEWRR